MCVSMGRHAFDDRRHSKASFSLPSLRRPAATTVPSPLSTSTHICFVQEGEYTGMAMLTQEPSTTCDPGPTLGLLFGTSIISSQLVFLDLQGEISPCVLSFLAPCVHAICFSSFIAFSRRDCMIFRVFFVDRRSPARFRCSSNFLGFGNIFPRSQLVRSDLGRWTRPILSSSRSFLGLQRAPDRTSRVAPKQLPRPTPSTQPRPRVRARATNMVPNPARLPPQTTHTAMALFTCTNLPRWMSFLARLHPQSPCRKLCTRPPLPAIYKKFTTRQSARASPLSAPSSSLASNPSLNPLPLLPISRAPTAQNPRPNS
jgi:hypothetical protein